MSEEFTPITSVDEAVQFFGGEDELLKYLNTVAPALAEAEEIVAVEAQAAVEEPEPDPRAVQAEELLDQYHLLKTNFKIREAMHKTIVSKFGPATQAARDSFQMMVQAEAELEQCKYEILELMGVDS